jgi:Rieske Fe-S protein
MSNQGKVDCGRRRLVVATAAVGGAGAVAALVPFVSSMLPSERAKAAGAPVEVDISKLEAGSDDDRRVARQAGVDHQPHQGNARYAAQAG